VPGTTYPALIGVDTSELGGNDRSILGDQTKISASSAVVSAAAAVATLPAVSGKTNYCTGVELDYQGATAAGVVCGAVSGVIGGARTFAIGVPAGATITAQPWIVQFDPPLQATASNATIVFTVPSLGSGNTVSQATIIGFVV
jgi:hypothetical protein